MKKLNILSYLKNYSISLSSNSAFKYLHSKKKEDKKLLLTDEFIYSIYKKDLDTLSQYNYTIYKTPVGEKAKNAQELQRLYDFLIQHQFQRNSQIYSFGGGVIGDLGGYLSATYMRGIAFYQVPTSLLAMVDSSIGGKVGINHPLAKNIIGTFKAPEEVWIDPALLKTLSIRELKSGLAEIIKHALIQDADYFKKIEKIADCLLDLDLNLFEDIIYRSLQIKKKIVEADEYEQNIRAILNYGHTLGHALESLTKYQSLSHGEAIAHGMMFAADISKKITGFSSIERHHQLLSKIITQKRPLFSRDEFLKTLSLDKKNDSNSIKLILLKQIGEAVIEESLPLEDLVDEIFDWQEKNP